MKTLVLGLGNTLLTDDGVGILVVRALSRSLEQPDVDIREACLGGLRLLDVVAGYERLILIDAIQLGGEAGRIYRLHPTDLGVTLHSSSSHDIGLQAAMELGRKLGLVVPEDKDIVILAIEAADTVTFGENCTPSVRSAVLQVAQMVEREISQTGGLFHFND